MIMTNDPEIGLLILHSSLFSRLVVIYTHVATSALRSSTNLCITLLVVRAEVDADTVDTMPLILRVSEPLALEDVPQMPSAVVAHNLRAHHTKTWIGSLAHCAWDSIPEGRPPAARIEFVVRFVQRCLAARAGIHTSVRVVLIVCAGTGSFGALLAQDAELLYNKVR
jgi:hypothetical protein